MTELRTEIVLQAPPERIWELLTDVTLYGEWNPLFVRGEGKVLAGERLELTVQLPAIPPFPIKPELLCAEPQARFQWRHAMSFTGLMCWTYGIELEPLAAGRVRFVQSSAFGGLLGPLFSFALGASVEGGMTELNQAVTRRGEQGNLRFPEYREGVTREIDLARGALIAELGKGIKERRGEQK